MRILVRYLGVIVPFTMLFTAGIASAGTERTNIRGMGMARTFVAGSRGLDAVGINPANLGYPDSGSVTLSLMPFGIHIGSDMMTYGIYRDYFTGTETDSGRTGRLLTDADKQRILGGFQGGVGQASADLEVRPIGVSIDLGTEGRLALTVTEQIALSADVPQEYAAFLLYGNPPGSTYNFNSTHVTAQWTREFGLSFGRSIPAPAFLRSLKAGIGIKFVQGFGYYEMNHFNTSLATGPNGEVRGTIGLNIRSSAGSMIDGLGRSGFTPFPNAAGTGWGFDVGISGEVTDFLMVGVAVSDIGAIHWSKELEMAMVDSSFVIDNALAAGQMEAVKNAVKGTRGPGRAFSTSLPTKFRLGVSAELNKIPFVKKFLFGEMSLAADYNQGFSDVPGSTTRGRLSVGLEYRPFRFLPIRTGVAFGGEDRTNFALGLGFRLGFLDIDVASENLNWLFDQDSFSYGSLAVGLKLRF